MSNTPETQETWKTHLNPKLVKAIELLQKYPTPRSDAAIEKCAFSQSGAALVVGAFAQVLESELAHACFERDEARAEVERLRKRVEELEAHPAFVVDMQTGKFTPMIATPTQPEIFEAHGLEWYRHTPGDKMPCEPGARVKIFLSMIDNNSKNAALPGYEWEWNEYGSITGWRPADAPEKLPRK